MATEESRWLHSRRVRELKKALLLKEWIFIAIALAGATVVLLPFLWMLTTSLRQSNEAYTFPPRFLPNEFRIINYIEVFKSSIPFVALFLNSAKVSIITTLAQLVTCSTAAYGFARLKFPGRDVIFMILLSTLMVPIQVTIIPIFLGMSKLRLVDTHWSLILPSLTSVFGVFLLRQFFLTLPHELEDSGKMDGAGYGTIFLRIILPQAGASVAALAIITFNNTWNSFFVPLIFLNSWNKMTLPLGIASLKGYMGSGNQSAVMAGICIAILPIVLAFIAAQRYFIEGVTLTGMKS